MIKRSIYSILIFLALIIPNPVLAQAPGPPGPPVGLVPWGPTEMFLLILLGYGIRKILTNRK
ncbi:hypothetical protein ACFL6G_08630 [candidate division KSB1 bacterium]